MVLYYGLTNYHLLCCMLHKIIYNSNEKAVFATSQGILKSRIKKLKESKIFNDVYFLEDTKIRDNCFNPLINNIITNDIIENTAYNFASIYESILPFNIDDFEKIYLSADHGVLGIYVLIKKKKYIYLEDGRGIYSNWEILDNLLKIKNPCLQIMTSYYNAYGRNKQIEKKYVSFDSQQENVNLEGCIDFDVNKLLDSLSPTKIEKILEVFDFKKCNIDYTYKNALVLTQRFSAYGLLEPEKCVLLYSLLCDIFAPNCKVYLKPHPADKCEYENVFKSETIIGKEMPSELLRFISCKNFDIGISTYSSSINSLKKYINCVYSIDDKIINFENKIFKLYTIFELAKKIGAKVLVDDGMLESCFIKCYNLEENSKIVFNYSKEEGDNSIRILDKYCNDANFMIQINKTIENDFINHNLLYGNDVLFCKTNDAKIIDLIKKNKIDNILPISKVHITTSLEKLLGGFMEEYIDLFDDNKKNTGIVIPRSKEKELEPGTHILVSALLIRNDENKIMMQLTSKEKGDILSLPSGHVLHGEDSKDTIIREMLEEQGIKIQKDKITLVEERLANKIAFFDIYYMEANFKKEDMKLQDEEVADVLWMSPEEIFSAYDNGKVRKSTFESIKNFLASDYNKRK